jgi:hypothetical protein
MAARTLCAAIRQRLYAFGRDLATPFSDSRRRRFVRDMVPGLVIAGHVHLTKVARALSGGAGDVRGVEKRLSRHLGSEHWDMDPLADRLLADSAAFVTDDTLIVADTTDLAKYYAKKLEGLGTVHDGPDPDKRLAPGYALFEAYARVGRWQLFPLLVEPLRVYAGAPTSENAEILAHMQRVHEAAGGKGTWVLDRGFDRRELFGPQQRRRVAFVARLLGTRHVQAADGRAAAASALAEGMRPRPRPRPRRGGHTACRPVRLPEVGAEEFLLVAHWRRWGREPLLLLVSPQARRPGRRAEWFVKAYRRRWGAEDATRGLKQAFAQESFLVRSWRAIRRLVCLVAWSFWWLSEWGQPEYSGWVEALRDHPWRLPKEVVYLFDWIAEQVHHLLHPRPRIELPAG